MHAWIPRYHTKVHHFPITRLKVSTLYNVYIPLGTASHAHSILMVGPRLLCYAAVLLKFMLNNIPKNKNCVQFLHTSLHARI